MDRKRKRGTLDLQLEAIADTLAMAQQESSPERRAQLLLVVERAFAVYHRSHKAAVLARPRLRLLQGGAVISVLAHPVAWWRQAQGEQRAVAMGLSAAAVGAGTLALAMWPGGGSEPPPLATPTMTVSRTVDMPPHAQPPEPSRSSLPPAPGPSASEVAPAAPRSPSEAAVSAAGDISPAAPAPEEPSPSGLETPDPSTDPEQPPGDGEDDDQEPTEPDRPDEEPGRPCLVDIDVSLIGINIGGLVCL